jgi:hypothetical protein
VRRTSFHRYRNKLLRLSAMAPTSVVPNDGCDVDITGTIAAVYPRIVAWLTWIGSNLASPVSNHCLMHARWVSRGILVARLGGGSDFATVSADECLPRLGCPLLRLRLTSRDRDATRGR